MSYLFIQAVRKIRNIARVILTRAMLCLHSVQKIIKPLSADEDVKRREYVLNIILALSLSALVILGSTLIWNKVHQGSLYSGMDPIVFACIIILYSLLLYLSKKGYISCASFLLVIFNALGTLHTGWKWGASLPETLLLTALTIVTASVLIGSTSGFVTASIMIICLSILGIHESWVLNIPAWRYDEITVTDIITYSVMFLFISFIAWISNRQIDLSLKKARQSEKLLEVERNILEQRIGERTEELILNQQKSLADAGDAIRVGELARGIIHDMMNPLTAITIYIEELKNSSPTHQQTAKHEMLDTAVQASVRMKHFMESVRHFIDPRHLHGDLTTDLQKEISMVQDALAYKARMSNIQIEVVSPDPILLPAHPLRIYQILINVVSNAIDACMNMNGRTDSQDRIKIIRIKTEKDHALVKISISDNGCGMSPAQIETLFTNPKTTKSQGTGIGLMNVHSIIKKELGGSIDVISEKASGTTFIITIPLHHHGESPTNHKK